MRKGLIGAIGVSLAALALQVGLLWLYHNPETKILCGDEVMYFESAKRLLAGDPGWQPELLWPPLYPQFIAGILALTGGGASSILAIQLVQIVLLAGCAVLLHDLALRLTGSRVTAWVASGWMVLFPPLVSFAHYLWPEISHLFVFLAALWLLQARWESDGWCEIAGIALGLSLLLKLLILPFVPLILVAVLTGKPRRRAVRSTIIIAALLGITIAPAVISNYRRSGVPAIADSIPFNLLVGLQDTSRRDFEEEVAGPAFEDFQASGATFEERNSATWTRIFGFLDERGTTEVLCSQLGRQYFRLFDKDSLFTVQLPGGRVFWCGYHERSQATVTLLSTLSYGLYALLLMTVPLGFLVVRASNSKWMKILLLFFLYNLLIFLWLHVKSRYRIQFLPVFFIYSGCAVDWTLSWLQGDAVEMPTAMRFLTAGAATATMLFLAFAGAWL